MLDKVVWKFVDEAGDEIAEAHLDISRKSFQVLAQELRIAGSGDERHLEMRMTLRTAGNGAALERGRRWLVIRAYEVLCDGPGEALTMPGRHLGSKATYAGTGSVDAEEAWERFSARVPDAPVRP